MRDDGKEMPASSIFEERLQSKRTTALFVLLAALFWSLWLRRKKTGRGGRLNALFSGLSAFFIFYVLNYHTLQLEITPQRICLRFGLFEWSEPLENIENCFVDETSLWRIGGAGIHFSLFAGRYRAMFNFLEYPRIVLGLKHKRGPVREIAFSTRHPGQVISLIEQAKVAASATGADS